MAAKELSTSVSEELLDEVWLMMHMAAEVGCGGSSSRTVADSGEESSDYDSKKYIFEAEVEPEFLDDVIETDDPGHEGEKERALIYAAERLMQIGDAVQREKEQTSEIDKVSKEIGDYIKEVMAPDIEQRLGQTSRSTATRVLAETGVLSLVYGVFKKKVEAFIGPDEDMRYIALVSSITKGVASGLQQSTSGIAGLLATVSTKFVEEKFGPMLHNRKSLTSIISQETMMQPQ